MRFLIRPILCVTLVSVLLPLHSGCSVTGSERAERATTKMEVVDGDIKKAIEQIDATNSSLRNLVSPEQSDTNKAFKRYADNVARMERVGERLIKHTDEMSARGQDYFEEWKEKGSSFANPEIQRLSDQRRSDLNAVFRNIAESSIGVKRAFISYMTDIKEIESFLATDLTAKGVESITPIAQQAITDGDDLKNAVVPVLSALDRARREMAQGGSN